MRYVVLLSLFLCACNRHLEHALVVDIPPAFQSMVAEFIAEGDGQGRRISITDLIIRFTSKLDSETLGECYDYHGEATNLILINENHWPYETYLYNKVTLFHELGHCVLHLGHDETGRVRNGYCTATSIMWPYIMNETNMYLENWNAYMLDLFQGIANEPSCSFNNYWGGT